MRWIVDLNTFNGLGLRWDAVVDVPLLPYPERFPLILADTAPVSQAAPQPPASDPAFSNHPQATLVRDTSIARGASADLAVRIAST